MRFPRFRSLIFLPTLVLLGLAVAAPSLAQDAPMKWGDVSDEHLAIVDFPADSNATAIILGDYGVVKVGGDGLTFTHHYRVKLLDEAAYDEYGTVKIGYDTDRQRIRGLKAQTLVPRPGGGFDRHKVDRKSFFTEELGDDFEIRSFTFPALQPGAIVEYSYDLQDEYIYNLPSWSFQTDQPVLWSELRVEVPDFLAYAFLRNNVSEFYISEQEKQRRPGTDVTAFRWVMKDVTALRSEPFMTTPADYRISIDAQLAQYRRGDGLVENVSNTWARLRDDLLESDFGDALDPTGDVRRRAADLTTGLTAPREKLTALYEYVRDEIEWQGSRGLWPQSDLDDVLETKQGNGGDKPLLLIALARAAGLDADPLLISTRDHGRTKQLYPMMSQFNHLLAHVKIGSEVFLLDPNSENAPFGMLGPRSLNGQGILMHEGQEPRWVPLASDVAYRRMIALTGTLREDGAFVGQLVASDAGYSGLVKRNRYEDAESAEEHIRDTYLDDAPNAELSNPAFEHMDAPEETLRTTADVVLPGAAQEAGEYLYVTPILLARRDENPLRSPTRSFPVDMSYKRDLIYNLRFTLPEGYRVEEMPPSLRVAIQGGGGMLTRVIGEQEGAVTVQLRFRMAKPIFQPRQYDALRDFYDRYIAAMDEPIILVRAEAPAPGAATEAEGGQGDGE